MFFSKRFRIADPIEAHSSCFSLYSAGKEAEPGRVIPRASDALAMVFAVYIFRKFCSVSDRLVSESQSSDIPHHMLRGLDMHVE